MPRRRTATASAALALAGAALAIGCGGKVIDAAKVEGALRANVQHRSGEPVRSVECPSGVPVEPGRTFACRVTAASGDVAIATLRIRNDQADVTVTGLRAAK